MSNICPKCGADLCLDGVEIHEVYEVFPDGRGVITVSQRKLKEPNMTTYTCKKCGEELEVNRRGDTEEIEG